MIYPKLASLTAPTLAIVAVACGGGDDTKESTPNTDTQVADQRPFTEGCKDYLVRLSSEYAWMSQPVDALVLESNTPFRLREANLRKGD